MIRDNLFDPALLREVNATWPAPDWPGWVQYDLRYEAKRASDLTTPIPLACGLLLAQFASLKFEGLLPDLGLHGSGLHEMFSGSSLEWHLDADTHKRLGLRRVLSGVVYVHERWDPDWGGELVTNELILPVPGRCVVFDAREMHYVPTVRCPVGLTRRSLAMFWYAPEAGANERPRAVFGGRLSRGT